MSETDYRKLFEELAHLVHRQNSRDVMDFPRSDQAVRDEERYEDLLDIAGVDRDSDT